MSEIVNEIKEQFARVLNASDWLHLLEVAEFHFETAAKLKKKNIRYIKKQLLMRNSMKRLHLGIGVELALKAAFLKNGKCINTFIKGYNDLERSPMHDIEELDTEILNPKDTYTLGLLIDKYARVFEVDPDDDFLNGLRIAMTFRNKEGHISFPRHEFDESNYDLIAASVVTLYKEVFNKKLEFKIAMKARDRGVFKNT